MAGPLPWQRRIIVERLGDDASRAAVARKCGVVPSTILRWLQRYPDLAAEVDAVNHQKWDAWQAAYEAKQAAEHEARMAAYVPPRRPHVRWRRDCPDCGGLITVCTTRNSMRDTHHRRGSRYYRCSRCSWMSWRPLAPGRCPHCLAPWYWAHSRRSAGCDQCGYRARVRVKARTSTT